MNPLTMEEISDVAVQVCNFSDDTLEMLRFVGAGCVFAAARAPDRPVVEVGMRCGGSTLLLSRLLTYLYAPAKAPFVFSVDPYGSKPPSGQQPAYGDHYGMIGRTVAAHLETHAHFRLRSLDFFRNVCGLSYWHFGVEDRISNFAFVYLDGDHSFDTIRQELEFLIPTSGEPGLLHPDGVVVIDNATEEPETVPWIKEHYCIEPGPQHANSMALAVLGVLGRES